MTQGVETLKATYREKKTIENAIEKEEHLVKKLQAEFDALDAKNKALLTPIEDLMTATALSQQLNVLAQKQAEVDKKNEKYEKYIQSKSKNRN